MYHFIIVLFIGVWSTPSYSSEFESPLADQFWIHFTQDLEKIQTEHDSAGNNVDPCDRVNTQDLLQFAGALKISCGSPSARKSNIKTAVATHFFDLAYKIKSKQVQCQMATLESFDNHKDIGILSYGGLHRFPPQGEDRNFTQHNFQQLNAGLLGSDLDSWGNDAPPAIYHPATSQRNAEVKRRQKIAVDNLYHSVEALNQLRHLANKDAELSSTWDNQHRPVPDCLKKAYRSRADRHLFRIDEVNSRAWGNDIPEVKKLTDWYAYFVLNPADPNREARFKKKMVDDDGLQGVIQDIGRRTSRTFLSELQSSIDYRRKTGQFSVLSKIALTREGYLETAYIAGTPDEVPSGLLSPLTASLDLRCELFKIYKRGPEVVIDDARVVEAVAVVAAFFWKPDMGAKFMETKLEELMGEEAAKRVAKRAAEIYAERKTFAITALSGAAAYTVHLSNNSAKLAERSSVPAVGSLCFREKFYSSKSLNDPPYDDIGKFFAGQNNEIDDILKEAKADTDDLFKECQQDPKAYDSP